MSKLTTFDNFRSTFKTIYRLTDCDFHSKKFTRVNQVYENEMCKLNQYNLKTRFYKKCQSWGCRSQRCQIRRQRNERPITNE